MSKYINSLLRFSLQVYGLDINPRAVKTSWINLYLNALDDNGLPVYDDEKKTLLDRVEFHESDLLGYCRDNTIQLERIVGCIPQVAFSIWSPITYNVLESKFLKSDVFLASFYLMFLWQILNPNPEAMSKMIEENASEEFLHSLSNYCALQVREFRF